MTRQDFFEHPFSIPANSKVKLFWPEFNKTITCYFKGYDHREMRKRNIESLEDLRPIFVFPKKDGTCPPINAHVLFWDCSPEKNDGLTLPTIDILRGTKDIHYSRDDKKWDWTEISILDSQFSYKKPKFPFVLTSQDREQLLEWGHLAQELQQIEDTANLSIFILDERKSISWEEAINAIGRTKFLSGISRSAFHWDCRREGIDVSGIKHFVDFNSGSESPLRKIYRDRERLKTIWDNTPYSDMDFEITESLDSYDQDGILSFTNDEGTFTANARKSCGQITEESNIAFCLAGTERYVSLDD